MSDGKLYVLREEPCCTVLFEARSVSMLIYSGSISRQQMQPSIIIRDPLIQVHPVCRPPSATITKLSLELPATIHQPHTPTACRKGPTPCPPQAAIAVREAVIQVQPRPVMVTLRITALRHQRRALKMHAARAGGEVASHGRAALLPVVTGVGRRGAVAAVGTAALVLFLSLVMLLISVLKHRPGNRTSDPAKEAVVHLVASVSARGATGKRAQDAAVPFGRGLERIAAGGVHRAVRLVEMRLESVHVSALRCVGPLRGVVLLAVGRRFRWRVLGAFYSKLAVRLVIMGRESIHVTSLWAVGALRAVMWLAVGKIPRWWVLAAIVV